MPLFGFFADLPDPRRHNVRHLFGDILAIAILAVMCRADDWSEIVLYANSWEPWLATFLSLPNGIPCEGVRVNLCGLFPGGAPQPVVF